MCRLNPKDLALDEAEGEVGPRQLIRATQPHWLAWAILVEVAALVRFRRQVGREVLIQDDRLQIVGEQDALSRTRRDEVHDAALETLVDEVAVARIRRRLRDRRAPVRQPAYRVELLQ